jgi:hypothetical protein
MLYSVLLSHEEDHHMPLFSPKLITFLRFCDSLSQGQNASGYPSIVTQYHNQMTISVVYNGFVEGTEVSGHKIQGQNNCGQTLGLYVIHSTTIDALYVYKSATPLIILSIRIFTCSSWFARQRRGRGRLLHFSDCP